MVEITGSGVGCGNTQSSDISLQESFYLDRIRELKADSSKSEAFESLEVHPELSIDEVLDRMESLNRFLEETNGVQLNSVRDHVGYAIERSKSFTDTRFECLFGTSPLGKSLGRNSKSMSKLLDYSFREKLIGFVSRKGRLLWDTDRISDFIESVAKSNNRFEGPLGAGARKNCLADTQTSAHPIHGAALAFLSPEVFCPMERDRAAIIKKYQQSLESLIEKYVDFGEDEGGVIDVFVSEEQSEQEVESISFIKNAKSEVPRSTRFVSFRDVYTILCTDCGFEDICRML